MLSRASTTSAAVENCWRTPPIARDGRSARRARRAPRRRRRRLRAARGGTRRSRPSRPSLRRLCEPFAHDALDLGDLVVAQPAKRRAHAAAHGDAAQRERRPSTRRGTAAPAAPREARRRARRAPRSGRARARRPHRGSSRRGPRPRRPPRARAPCGISDSGPTKMSSPSSRYGSKRSHGVSETFSPTKFAASSRSDAITGSGTGIAAARRELVDVERQRLARLAAAAVKCSSSSSASNAKYGGAITATASAPASAACSASATVSAVVCAPQCTATWSRPRPRDEELGHALALLDDRRARPRRSSRARAGRRPRVAARKST